MDLAWKGGKIDGPCCASIPLTSLKCHIPEQPIEATGRDQFGCGREFEGGKVTLESDPRGPDVPGWGYSLGWALISVFQT